MALPSLKEESTNSALQQSRPSARFNRSARYRLRTLPLLVAGSTKDICGAAKYLMEEPAYCDSRSSSEKLSSSPSSSTAAMISCDTSANSGRVEQVDKAVSTSNDTRE